MSSPPPGYNPEASQLQGGDAPIAKVMGGGGMEAPPGYNETQSLLQGGTEAPIVKMSGGASVSSVSSEHRAEMEVYAPSFSAEDKTEIQKYLETFSIQNPGLKQEYIRLIKDVKSRSEPKLVRFYNKSKTPQKATLPTVSVPTTPAHKIVEIIPDSVSNIIIMPPMKGNYELFIKSVEFLYDNNVIVNNVVQNALVIFLAPFFGTGKEQQGLLYSVLKLQEKNADKVIIIGNDDETSREIGRSFYDGIPEEDGVLVNFLNPSYVIIKKKVLGFDGILFSSSRGQETSIPLAKNKNFVSPAELLDKRAFSYNAGSLTDPAFLNYMTFLSQNDMIELPVSKADISVCKNLRTVFDLTAKMFPFEISAGDDIFVLRLGGSKHPFLCSNLMDTSATFENGESDPSFVNAPVIEITAGGQRWSLRDPSRSRMSAILDKIAVGALTPESRNEVLRNWELCIFSKEEAAFLNHMNLSPRLLGLVFKSDVWKKELAKFMNNLVTSSCFDDVTLLSKATCEESRVFLTKVYSYIFAFEALQDEGTEIPALKLPPIPKGHENEVIQWPPVLEEIDPNDFKPGKIGSLETTTDTRMPLTYFIDILLVHRKSFQFSPRRLRLDYEKVEADLVENQIIFSEILEDLKDDYPDFLFIY
jgi:hypothetical protein